MTETKIRQALFSLQDPAYRNFQIKLIPGLAPDRMIGIRTPQLRALARSLRGLPETRLFLEELPHAYFDEDQLHAFLLSEEKDFEECIRLTEAFLPYVNNWATCDQLSPKAFRKYTDRLLPYIRKWISSGQTYTVRFGIGMLMQHYLDEHFDPVYPEYVAGIRSSEYYVNMMIAWYFATALAKQYETVLPYIEKNRLDPWTHNKAIQKSVESRRISAERKEYLRSLRRTSKDRFRKQIERIRYYESILCQAQQALEEGTAVTGDPGLTAKLRELEAYYGSADWKTDFAADEAGLLPSDLKRGVLSEDGIYNVLQDYDELLR